MKKELSNPLQSLLNSVAESTPKTTGITKEKSSRRLGASSEIVIVCDCSSSMAESAGAKTKHEMLEDAVRKLHGPGITVISFSSMAEFTRPPIQLARPSGSTNLAAAIELAGTLKPAKTIVLCDGHPDSESDAIQAAAAITGTIDAIFIGPDSDSTGKAFMRMLASRFGGRFQSFDLARLGSLSGGQAKLTGAIRNQLRIGHVSS